MSSSSSRPRWAGSLPCTSWGFSLYLGPSYLDSRLSLYSDSCSSSSQSGTRTSTSILIVTSETSSSSLWTCSSCLFYLPRTSPCLCRRADCSWEEQEGVEAARRTHSRCVTGGGSSSEAGPGTPSESLAGGGRLRWSPQRSWQHLHRTEQRPQRWPVQPRTEGRDHHVN